MTTETATDVFYRPNRRVAARIVDGQLVILKPETDELLQFNEVATFVWSCLEGGPQTAEQLVENILDEFEVDQAQAKSDLSEFIEQMLAHSHLEVCSKP